MSDQGFGSPPPSHPGEEPITQEEWNQFNLERQRNFEPESEQKSKTLVNVCMPRDNPWCLPSPPPSSPESSSSSSAKLPPVSPMGLPQRYELADGVAIAGGIAVTHGKSSNVEFFIDADGHYSFKPYHDENRFAKKKRSVDTAFGKSNSLELRSQHPEVKEPLKKRSMPMLDVNHALTMNAQNKVLQEGRNLPKTTFAAKLASTNNDSWGSSAASHPSVSKRSPSVDRPPSNDYRPRSPIQEFLEAESSTGMVNRKDILHEERRAKKERTDRKKSTAAAKESLDFILSALDVDPSLADHIKNVITQLKKHISSKCGDIGGQLNTSKSMLRNQIDGLDTLMKVNASTLVRTFSKEIDDVKQTLRDVMIAISNSRTESIRNGVSIHRLQGSLSTLEADVTFMKNWLHEVRDILRNKCPHKEGDDKKMPAAKKKRPPSSSEDSSSDDESFTDRPTKNRRTTGDRGRTSSFLSVTPTVHITQTNKRDMTPKAAVVPAVMPGIKTVLEIENERSGAIGDKVTTSVTKKEDLTTSEKKNFVLMKNPYIKNVRKQIHQGNDLQEARLLYQAAVTNKRRGESVTFNIPQGEDEPISHVGGAKMNFGDGGDEDSGKEDKVLREV